MQWVRTYGSGPENDWIYDIVELNNGDFLLSGRLAYTYDFGYGSLLRISNEGDLIWAKTYNDSGFCLLYQSEEDANGDIISAGRIDKTGNGNYDMMILKTDGNGDPIWCKIWSGNAFDFAKSLEILEDGSMLIGAITESYGFGGRDASLIKTDASGNIIWAQVYGGPYEDTENGSSDFIINEDSNIYIKACTNSFGTTGSDFYIIKTDASGYSGCNEMAYMPEVATFNPVVNSPTIYSQSPGLGIANTVVNDVVFEQNTLCSDTITTNTKTNIQYKLNSFDILPNPAENSIKLTFDKAGINYYGELATITGERIKTFDLGKSNETTLDLQGIRPGLYILNLYDRSGSFVQSEKLIIK